jgi:hypothetical protein
MLDARFCYLAGTGRTGTHWLDRLFKKYASDVDVASFHDGLPDRLKARPTPGKELRNYLLNLMCRRQARIYIECNPALIEWVGLRHRIKEAYNVLPVGLLTHEPRAAIIVRHPFGYVKSLKAKGWGWKWWNLPGFDATRYNKLGRFEQYCYAWAYKVNYASSLMNLERSTVVKFEDIFERDGKTAVDEVRRLASLFDVQLTITDAQIKHLRQRKIAPKGGHELTLTEKERKTCLQFCKPTMETLGYE